MNSEIRLQEMNDTAAAQPEHGLRITRRDYWSTDATFKDGMRVHGPEDERAYFVWPNHTFVEVLLEPFEDGDVLEVCVRKVGQAEGHWQRSLTNHHVFDKVERLRRS